MTKKNQKWKDMEKVPFDFNMELGYDAFKKEVEAWKTNFEKSRNP